MFGEGYVVGAIVTAIGLYACSKYKKLAEREDSYDNDRTN